ncbi:hypothetical protein LAUMK13_01813 [Mycobacterium innocens]|uniref:Uncharacterized protein n=1 Tax=Mycobacterium innocens TaxID=2341083 RepID=A0A498PYF5_9MYCO|nr:hypothetical protein LAUMK13_01813 [Mycobacterium innocens]
MPRGSPSHVIFFDRGTSPTIARVSVYSSPSPSAIAESTAFSWFSNVSPLIGVTFARRALASWIFNTVASSSSFLTKSLWLVSKCSVNMCCCAWSSAVCFDIGDVGSLGSNCFTAWAIRSLVPAITLASRAVPNLSSTGCSRSNNSGFSPLKIRRNSALRPFVATETDSLNSLRLASSASTMALLAS